MNKERENENLMLNEAKLLIDIVEFNNAYAKYVSCSYNDTGCTSSDMNIQLIYDKLPKFDTDIKNLNTSLNANSSKTTIDKYHANRKDILNKYNNNITITRSELDSKLKELYEINGSLTLDNKYQYDATIYSGILMTILATGLIYYTFTKL
jgi:hypothetical protein